MNKITVQSKEDYASCFVLWSLDFYFLANGIKNCFGAEHHNGTVVLGHILERQGMRAVW